ncbi:MULTISPECIES: EAL domain-containing protein [unclassified Burkholderia]|uniref:EAL domain-containing protein n=1 Tax=unclassified Burkholderia TaxID=2613784 RepID=UPI002AB1020F|nr:MULTISPECIES: EAL domain-containing protein [unclassified Burkholderia]
MSHCVKVLMQPAPTQDSRLHVDSDMRAAGMVLTAIARDRVMLWAQPILSVRDGEHVLYHECLVRILGTDDHPIAYPSAFIPSLERLQLMRFLDRYVVGMAIEFMESNVDLRLGVNISAQSANDIQWWESILLLLESRPDIASRLVVEITETTQLSPVSGRTFVARLQRMGCSIAVDDFGDGFSVENGARIASPDIVKIAGRMSPTDGGDGVQFEQFEKLVARARDHAPQVVVEGIEGVDGLLAASLAGAQWVQGYHTGKPGRLKKAECSTVGTVGRSMQQFERVADALIDRQVDEKTRDDAKLAYSVGLSSALYGRRSAIATSLHCGLIDVMRMKSGPSNISVQLLQCFVVLGRINGQTLARSLGSGAYS